MENERARGCLRRNTCFNGVWAVAAVEVVGLHMVELTMGAATIVEDLLIRGEGGCQCSASSLWLGLVASLL